METLLHTCVLAFVLYLYYSSLQEEKQSSKPMLATRRKLNREDHDGKENTHQRADLEEAVIRSIFFQMERCSKKADTPSLEYLKECLAHPRVEISTKASEILSTMDHPKALEILLSYIEDLDQRIQIKEKEIESRKQESKRPLEVKKKSFKKAFISDLIQANDYEILRAYLGSNEINPKPIPLRTALLQCASDEAQSPAIRHHAIHSLKAFDQVPPSNLIAQWLYERDVMIKQASMEIVRHFQIFEFIPRLEVEIMNLNPAVALEAIYTLNDLGSIKSLSKLEILLNHKEILVREAARFAVTNLKDQVKLGSNES